MGEGGLRTAAVVLALALAGCAAEKPKPTPLVPLTAKIAGRQIWSARVDGIRMPLNLPVRDGAVTVAGADGTVMALDLQTGREQWRGQAGARLSAGVGTDGRWAAVVTVGSELVVLERGVRKWSARLDSSTITAPLVAGERVFVMGVDRIVHAFDAVDGRRLWSYSRTGEALTLAQPGVLVAYKDTLVVGQGASLVGIDPTKGSVRWETAITSPRGTNEVERLNDLIGPALRLGDLVCARAFQTAVGCVAANNATLKWSRLVGGLQALGGDADLLFGADASDRITAWRTPSGETAWTNETLLYRGLSGPAVAGRTVIFGDAEGQVHFLDRQTGEALLRQTTDGSAVIAPPVVVGTTVLVATRNGGIFAFRPE
ncbi:outer membrane protein assembly factor BamB [Ideonella sp. A 288]|uniref:outer membrane protein assembly factor BamB n=1 Tax=Ideonella sp. A 288 TaxID=1962181 RepID=UPI000B4BB66B|nr:outer membrane protein assembly factor BamB [Ideonella sp. A 288]